MSVDTFRTLLIEIKDFPQVSDLFLKLSDIFIVCSIHFVYLDFDKDLFSSVSEF